MSRRDEREIERRLREVPGGEPPGDLLDRLRADLPGGAALREDAAARRRPPALDRRWLLAASLAAMTAAGLLALHTMEPVGERSFSTAAAPERALESPRYAGEAPRRALEAPAPEGAVAPGAAGGHFDASPGEAPPRTADRAGATVHRFVAPQELDRDAPRGAGEVSLPKPRQQRIVDELAAHPPAPAREAEDPVVELQESALPDARPDGRSDARGAGAPAARPVAAAAAPPVASAAPAPSAATSMAMASTAPRPASPPPAARLEARAKAAAPTNAAPLRAEVAVTAESGAMAGASADAEGGAAQPAAPRLWAPEVAELAAAYDDDSPAVDGWALAAGGTPPPPKVAGMPVHGPPAGALWVRFRVRALDPALAPAGSRVEVAWTPGALRDRRLLGGEAGRGEADVFPLSAGALRRGWTAVYEVRPALLPRRSFESLATLRVVTAEGAPIRELALPLSALSRSWMDAPSTLRLPCLAAAFAERRALGAPEGYVDLVAAARSLAVARGGRPDPRAATLLELIVRADHVLPASPP